MANVKFGFSAEKVSDDETKKKIKALKQSLENENLPDLNDEQILHFLIRCDGDLSKTKDMIKHSYKLKSKASYMFSNRNSKDLKTTLEQVELCTMPQLTEDGCAVIFVRCIDLNLDLENFYKLYFMTIDSLIYKQPLRGIIPIFDLDGLSFWFITKIKINPLRHFLAYFQEGMPIKMKEAHCLNTGSFINAILKIVKPFVKSEFLERTYFHVRDVNMETFYKDHLEKKCLPKDLGGDLPSTMELHRENVQKLESLTEHFAAEETQRKS